MAAWKRKKKIPVPDWLGETYDKDDIDTGRAFCEKPHSQNLQNQEVSKKMASSAGACVSTGATVPSAKWPVSAKTSKGSLISGASIAPSSGEEVRLTASEIIAQSMPFLQFTGSLVYSCNSGDCTLLCEDIMSCLSPDKYLHVGFDIEWPVTYIPRKAGKVALVQICTADDKCYLFHIAAMGEFPCALKNLISHSNVTKYGLNIEADFWKLERDFSMHVREVIRSSVKDIGRVANERLKSAERWTLDGLCRNVLRKRLDKNSNLRCGRWDDYPLSDEQKRYAAADAYACLLLAKYFEFF